MRGRLGWFLVGVVVGVGLFSWLLVAAFAAVGLALGSWRARRRFADLRVEAAGCPGCGGRPELARCNCTPSPRRELPARRPR